VSGYNLFPSVLSGMGFFRHADKPKALLGGIVSSTGLVFEGTEEETRCASN